MQQLERSRTKFEGEQMLPETFIESRRLNSDST